MATQKNSHRPGTREYAICEMALDGKTASEIYAITKRFTLDQVKPFVFTANVGGGRVVKPMPEQIVQLRYAINRILAKMGRATLPESDETPAEETGADTDEIEEEFNSAETDQEESEEVETEESEESESVPAETPNSKVETAKRFFLQEVRRIREFCKVRALNNDPIDHISMRPVTVGRAGLENGIDPRALLASMTLDWDSSIKQAAGIEEFDFAAYADGLEIPEECLARLDENEELHKLAPYAYALAISRIPIYLVGPAGTGKSHVATQLAKLLDLPYGETPMTAGATPSWLIGSVSLPDKLRIESAEDGTMEVSVGSFRTREFLECYANGGVFNFEEMDSADANLLIVANNALAGSQFFNPANGERYDKSDNFIGVATANTFGLGANKEYTGRTRLDAATRDRWRMGRIYVELDEQLEESLLFN